MEEKGYIIDSTSFEFVQENVTIHDTKLETKPIGFFRDCLRRFRKNKASVAASIIIGILFLFAIFAPLATSYGKKPVANEGYYSKMLPKTKHFQWLGWDGTKTETIYGGAIDMIEGLSIENNNRNPIKKIKKTYYIDGVKYYDAKIDSYLKVGYIYIDLSAEEYVALQKYQNETGIQVMYPITANYKTNFNALDSANLWYKLKDDSELSTGEAEFDEDGNYIPNYLVSKRINNDKYDSLRIEDDTPIYDSEGNRVYYQYGVKNQTGYHVRLCYYDYYTYKYGHEPFFWFGTDQFSNDIFTCLGLGARLSFILAFAVSIINLVIGFIYGAIEGYYGGVVDLAMERISDILSAVPFIVVATLFQLHFADKVGPLPSLLFAFVTTGWIGIASGVRTQFYRFKNQEYVLAARTLGAKDSRLIWRHIFPNAMGTIITSCVLIIPGVIFSESILSYLGIVSFKTSETLTSVGTMLSNGESFLSTFPHIIAFPAAFISLLEISFNLFGNGLRDAFNPSLRGSEE